jgi:ribulose-bisphosphate carboxylase large chain
MSASAPPVAERRFEVVYRVRAAAGAIEARAQGIALEQSVELPLAAVRDARVRDEVVGRVAAIVPAGDGMFDATIELATETTNGEAGQLLNMLFGNASLLDDVELVDLRLPPGFAQGFGGPRHGIAGLRARCGAVARPLTCSALKPQGLTPEGFAALAGTLARAGVDVIKDDNGLADQASAPFEARVRAVQRAVAAANRSRDGRTLYAPNLSGDYATMRRRAAFARDEGVEMLMLAPMLSGVASLAALAQDAGVPILAHPALAGVARIAPPVLLGTLFRVFGADATIFPNFAGRFGYTRDTCRAIADAARGPLHGLAPALPVPAGGMTLARVAEMRAFFGDDAMLLIGGDLLVAGDGLAERCRAFVDAAAAPAETDPEPGTVVR